MKTFRIEPVGKEVDVATATTVVQGLLAEAHGSLKQVCGGKGICATCHVRVVSGAENLSPLGKREKTTLSLLTGTKENSRLACQAKVLGPGVVVELPPGMYLDKIADLEALVGRRAEEPLCHPITGAVVVAAGKIITRSVVQSLKNFDMDVITALERSKQTL